jgi:hypothetical protein
MLSNLDIHNLNMDTTFLVLGRDEKKDGYFIYLILKIYFFGLIIIICFFSELEKRIF